MVFEQVARATPSASLTSNPEHFSEDAWELLLASQDTARRWRHLATIAVPHALPDESPAARRQRTASLRLARGLVLAGDHNTTASINGALVSGRRSAEAVMGEESLREARAAP